MVEETVAEEETTEAPSEAQLKKMKKAELVELAESMDLATSGTKADLIEKNHSGVMECASVW